jgi:L-rhamnose mutarotase
MLVERFVQVVRVKPERIDDYEQIHAAVWPSVLATIRACNIRNYSIYRYNNLLIAYFDYVGEEFESDMGRMAADPGTQEWWTHTDPMQEPVQEHKPGQWWTRLPEVFHTD